MNLEQIQAHWNALGEQDPLWAILSDPEKSQGRWDLAEFFATGRSWIAEVMEYVDHVAPGLGRDRALDFGCGVGRLTQALSEHFAHCDGVDIAPSMVRRAESVNRFGDKCCYHLQRAPNLACFDDDSFDFVYSILVLQHVAPVYAAPYIGEFLRVLKPGGIVIFQVPDATGAPRRGSSPVHEQLPRETLKADLRLEPPPDSPIFIEAGRQVQLKVHIANSSSYVWPALADYTGNLQLTLVNRWLLQDGAVAVAEDGRALLPCDMLPRDEREVTLLVAAPSEPGQYVLEIALLQDGVEAWHSGHASTKVMVEVVPLPLLDEMSADSLPTQIQMFGLSRPRVLDLIRDSGGVVIEVREENSAGEHWTSYTYCATRRHDLRRV